jgi:hypothetical protein
VKNTIDLGPTITVQVTDINTSIRQQCEMAPIQYAYQCPCGTWQERGIISFVVLSDSEEVDIQN